MTDWHEAGLDDDMRQHMFALKRERRPFALATIVAANGGPRPVGAQMVITDDICCCFLLGSCIEADVALHGREVLSEGEPRHLVYGLGSPFVDMRLPCGGRLEVLVERVPQDDSAVATLEELTRARQPAFWTSDGRNRSCDAAGEDHGGDAVAARIFHPRQRLVVIGADPFALAIAGMGATLDWEVTLVCPFGPEAAPSLPIGYSRQPVERAFAEIGLDAWTAVAIATHDLDHDQDALVSALPSEAGYVGVLGARRRLPERLALLRAAGLDESALIRLRAPIGLALGATSPWEVAVSVAGEIIASGRGAVQCGLTDKAA
jgi:xanthine dehydrogenase accessory factor